VAVPNADDEQVVAFVAKNHDGRFITIDADGPREFCAFTNGLWIFSKTLEGGVKAIDRGIGLVSRIFIFAFRRAPKDDA
jgi:hypothetical protein